MVVTSVTGTAQVRISYGAGLDIRAARESRITVVGDDLVVSTPRAGTQRFALSEVKAVWWLDPASTASVFATRSERFLVRRNRALSKLTTDEGVFLTFASGACVVQGTRGPLTAWLLDEVGSAHALPPAARREASGSSALASACGTALVEAPVAPDRVALRRVAVRAGQSSRWSLAVTTWAAFVALFLAARGWVGFDGDLAWPYAAGALVLVLPVAVAAGRVRAEALGYVTTAPPPAGRVVHQPPSARGTPRQLQAGPDDVVLIPGDGSETWLAGPGVEGGVCVVQIAFDRVSFVDSAGLVLHTDWHGPWFDGPEDVEALRAALADTDIRVDEVMPFERARRQLPTLLWNGPSLQAGDLSPVQPWLMWFLAPMTVVAGFAAMRDAPVVGWVVVAGGLVALALKVWCWWAWRRWLRAARRRGAI